MNKPAGESLSLRGSVGRVNMGILQAPTPDLTVTVVSWNTRALLAACLESLRTGCKRHRLEVQVVDNASTDGSPEMVRTDFPEARLTVNRENVGFARANNQCWNQVRGRYWMLLNSDAAVRPGALDELIDFMDARPRAGLATARLVNPDGSPQYCAQPVPSIGRTLFEASRLHKLTPASWRRRILLSTYWTYDRPLRLGWTWGTALVARREAVEQVGLLSEAFFMYGEDVDWCLRMRRGGWEVWFCPDAEVVHHGGQSAERHWDARGQKKRKLDGYYRAVAQHHGRCYSRLLRACDSAAGAIESVASRLRRCVRVKAGRHPA